MSNQPPSLAHGAMSGRIWPAAYLLGFFLLVGFFTWQLGGAMGNFVFLSLVGVFTGAGFLIRALVLPARKQLGSRVSLAAVGLSLFLGAGVFGRQSFQLEGLFFYLLSGVAGGVVVHYAVAKIFGPFLIGRSYCGWGCWTWMVLDYLPYKRNRSPRSRLSWLRWAMFAVSLGAVLLLWFGFGYRHGTEWKTTDGLIWFLGGNAIYYALGIALALAFEDNRAFCKVLCPIAVFLRIGARHSLLKVSGDESSCHQCGACERTCPMDVPITAFVQAGQRVSDPECVLCQRCIDACPRKTLSLSLGPRRPFRKTLPDRGSSRSSSGSAAYRRQPGDAPQDDLR